MTLSARGMYLDIAQATPTHLYLRNPAEFPSGAAELLISIDGSVTRQSVQIQNDAGLNSNAVPFQRAE